MNKSQDHIVIFAMNKEGQWLGEKWYTGSLLSPTQWGRQIGEVFRPDYKKKMNALREADDRIKNWAKDLDGLVKKMRKANRSNRIMEVAVLLSELNNRLKEIEGESNRLEEMNESGLDDLEKSMSEFETQYEGDFDVELLKGLEVQAQFQWLKDWKKKWDQAGLEKKQRKERRMAINKLIDIANTAVKNVKKLLPQLKKHRKAGDIGDYIKALSKVSKEQNKFRNSFVPIYNQYLKPVVDRVLQKKEEERVEAERAAAERAKQKAERPVDEKKRVRPEGHVPPPSFLPDEPDEEEEEAEEEAEEEFQEGLKDIGKEVTDEEAEDISEDLEPIIPDKIVDVEGLDEPVEPKEKPKSRRKFRESKKDKDKDKPKAKRTKEEIKRIKERALKELVPEAEKARLDVPFDEKAWKEYQERGGGYGLPEGLRTMLGPFEEDILDPKAVLPETELAGRKTTEGPKWPEAGAKKQRPHWHGLGLGGPVKGEPWMPPEPYEVEPYEDQDEGAALARHLQQQEAIERSRQSSLESILLKKQHNEFMSELSKIASRHDDPYLIASMLVRYAGMIEDQDIETSLKLLAIAEGMDAD